MKSTTKIQYTTSVRCSRRASFAQGLFGFSLIELMIAIVIGIFLMLGAVNILISNKTTYRIQQNLSRMYENARFTNEYLKRAIRMTAYRGEGPGEWVLGPITQAHGIIALQGIDNDSTNNAAIKDGTDIITVIFEGNSDTFVKDCQGNAVAAGTTSNNTFSISNNDELQCSIDNGTTFVPLATGIESMQILYGLDTDFDQVTNNYVTADNVADTDMDDVVSIRIGLLMVSEDDNLALETDTKSYTLLNQTIYSTGSTANDKRLRKMITTTVKLRNRL